MIIAIINYCQQLNIDPDPENIITDFGISMIQAILGDDITIAGCFYHLTQTAWRKIQDLAMVNRYRDDEAFRHFCGMLGGLAFLPGDDVIGGFEHLRLIAPDGTYQLLTYFDNTYVNGIYRGRQNGNNIRVRRIPPRFPPATWNVHERTLADESRTNNLCEGWNSRFSSMVGFTHPSIWKAIKSIQVETNEASTNILQSNIGNPPRKHTKRMHIQQQQRRGHFYRGHIYQGIFTVHLEKLQVGIFDDKRAFIRKCHYKQIFQMFLFLIDLMNFFAQTLYVKNIEEQTQKV